MARRSEGLLRFIEAYRALARVPEPSFADVNVRRWLEEQALLFRSRWTAGGVTLEFEPPPGDSAVAFDADLLGQVLLNVLTNAAEAALEGSGPPTVRLTASVRADGRLAIEVEDSGPGVNLPDPSAIFRPFFTTKPQGTGVGLSLARQVVLAHGGEISIADGAAGAKVTIVV